MAAPVPPGAPRATNTPPPPPNYNPNYQRTPDSLAENMQNLQINRPPSVPNSTPRPPPSYIQSHLPIHQPLIQLLSTLPLFLEGRLFLGPGHLQGHSQVFWQGQEWLHLDLHNPHSLRIWLQEGPLVILSVRLCPLGRDRLLGPFPLLWVVKLPPLLGHLPAHSLPLLPHLLVHSQLLVSQLAQLFPRWLPDLVCLHLLLCPQVR